MKSGGFIRRDLEKCREWLQKGRGLLERAKGLPKVNRDRKARREAAGEVYGAYHKWVGTQRCTLWCYPSGLMCFGPVCGHHLKSVAAGGKDAENEVTMCAHHHRQLHDLGPTRFEQLHECDLDLHAAALWSRYCTEIQ